MECSQLRRGSSLAHWAVRIAILASLPFSLSGSCHYHSCHDSHPHDAHHHCDGHHHHAAQNSGGEGELAIGNWVIQDYQADLGLSPDGADVARLFDISGIRLAMELSGHDEDVVPLRELTHEIYEANRDLIGLTAGRLVFARVSHEIGEVHVQWRQVFDLVPRSRRPDGLMVFVLDRSSKLIEIHNQTWRSAPGF